MSPLFSTGRGLLTLSLYTLNFMVCGLIVFALAPFKFIPTRASQNFIRHLYRQVPKLWTLISHPILQLTNSLEWDIQMDPAISPTHTYLLISNHQSWFDIIALQKALNQRAPQSVYFMKRALLWVPVMGLACWLLDFPFMHRFSKQYLKQHPHKKGLDFKLTQRVCERYRDHPVTLINFVEGTRFQTVKQQAQHSPYQHLLKPRSGGLAFALATMNDQIEFILNTTIVYEARDRARAPTLWQIVCGHYKKISVRIELIPVTAELRGNYQEDAAYREQFQAWLNQLWKEKDSLIETLQKKFPSRGGVAA